MDRNRIEHYRDMLLKQKEDIEKTMERMEDDGTAEQHQTTPVELSNYDNHPADLGTEMFMITMNNALKVHEEHIHKEVHDALQRIHDRKFGNCTICGQEIGEERLEAIPYARLCIECEENRTVNAHQLENRDRPAEESVWDAPFGQKYLNKREDDEYEGLDYLFDLEKYGSSDSPQDMGGYHLYEEYYTNDLDKQGIVDNMDQVSNEEYKKQLPD